MKNLTLKLKMFLKNKNTVTVICVLLMVLVIFIGYYWRVNQAIDPVRVPYALDTIDPRTQITQDMIGYREIARAAVTSDVITSAKNLIGFYANANTVIPKGSMFYKGTVVQKDELPDSALYGMPLDETLYYLGVNMTTSYSNTILPGNYIDIYIQTITTDNDGNNKVMVGKLLSNVLVRAVKTSNGLNVFETSEETRTPATVIFSVKEDIHLLLRKAALIGRLNDQYTINIIPVPNTTGFDGNDTDGVVTTVTSEYLKNFIEEKSIYLPQEELENNVNNQTDGGEDE